MDKVVFIVGPTASGKTEYAIRLAEELDGEIVSADSMQIYKYMDVGSAKPTIEERSRIPHYLVDEIDPSQPFSVAEYKSLAEKYIRQILNNKKLPVVCGGTGLYIDSLLFDLDFSAAAGNREGREALKAKIGQGNPQKLHAYLSGLDPEAGKLIHPNNVKRVLRAIERLESGEEQGLAAFSDCRKITEAFSPVILGLSRDRQALYARIERRVDRLIKDGLVAEVSSLMAMGLTENDIAMKGIGYKEIISCIKDGLPGEAAADVIKKNTRHYAKRQMTWFKRYEKIKWFSLKEDILEEDVLNEMIKYIKCV